MTGGTPKSSCPIVDPDFGLSVGLWGGKDWLTLKC